MTRCPRPLLLVHALMAAPLAFAAPNAPVINEFHFKPEDKTSLEEFVEIHNTSADTAIDLSGWKLDDAVSFTFPGGTTLAPGGYLVVAQQPSVIPGQVWQDRARPLGRGI